MGCDLEPYGCGSQHHHLRHLACPYADALRTPSRQAFAYPFLELAATWRRANDARAKFGWAELALVVLM